MDEKNTHLNKAVNLLDTEYKNEPFYKKVKTILYSNPIHTLIKMKGLYYHSGDTKKLEDIEALLDKWIAIILDLCANDKNLAVANAIATFRKGLYKEDEDLIQKDLDFLKEPTSKEFYKIVNHELGDYRYDLYDIMIERILKIKIANNMREYRLGANLTVDQLSGITAIVPDFLRQMESQERTVSEFNLLRAADVFEVTIDELMGVFTKYNPGKLRERARLIEITGPYSEEKLNPHRLKAVGYVAAKAA